MMNNSFTSEFIFGASERELLTLSLAEIIDGLMADYKGFNKSDEAGIRIPENKHEPRMSHSCILYAEGLRLAHTHLELAKKLMLASLFNFSAQANYWFAAEKAAKEAKKQFDLLEEIEKFNNYSTRAFAWLKENGGSEQLMELLKEIKAFEDFKAAERKKKEDKDKEK